MTPSELLNHLLNLDATAHCYMCGAVLPADGHLRVYCSTRCSERRKTLGYPVPPRPPWDRRFCARFVVEPSGCWSWTGHIKPNGYGNFSMGPREVPAHRWAYEFAFGAIPEGLQIDHLCRNPPCVNPLHMEAVTLEENVLRGESPPARNRRKTHCKHGHEFTSENTIRVKRGRQCRQCRLRQLRERWARKRITQVPQPDLLTLIDERPVDVFAARRALNDNPPEAA